MDERGRRKERVGVVTSTAMDKTVTVSVPRVVQHPLYKKIIRKSKKYHAHDPINAHKVGDTVRIRECRPISKQKTWEVLREDAGAAVAAADAQ